MNHPSPTQPISQRLRGPRWLALILLLLGLVALSQIFQIGQAAGYVVIGPRFFPSVVVGGLLLLSLLFLLRTTRFPDADLAAQAASEDATTDWMTMGQVAVTLVVYVFLLGPLGYSVATALFFPVIAWILGSRHPARDLLIGFLLGLVIYLAFTRVLGVRLPAGILRGLL